MTLAGGRKHPARGSRGLLGLRASWTLVTRTLLLLAVLAGLGARLALASASQAQADQTGALVQVTLTTADLTRRLTPQPNLRMKPEPRPPGTLTISVDPSRSFQSFTGVGASLTDTSAWLIHEQLPSFARRSLMAYLFGAGGMRLSFLRVPMGASDFTAAGRPYTYDDLKPGSSDPQLTRFSIAHDLPYVLPTLRQALALNPRAFLIASPWSPPAWMKANDGLDNEADRGKLLPEMTGPLAGYFVHFLKAYARAGVHIDAVTPQNEPGNATLYPGLELGPHQEARFVSDNLAPALRAAHLTTQIYGYDWGWSPRSLAAARILARPGLARPLSGLASHCYFGPPTVMSDLHAENPRLRQIVSECSPGITPYSTSELEIASLRNWASAVALWNLALDPRGGPVQPPNHGCPGCSALVTVDERTHTATPTIDLFQLGQLSRFAQPGATRVFSTHAVTYSYLPPTHNIASAGVDDVALRNPDGGMVLMAYNSSTQVIHFDVSAQGAGYFSYTLAPAATVTFRWHP